MQRKIDNVFKELNRKGMTRAFIDTGDREYIYPAIGETKKAPRKTVIIVTLSALFTVFALLFYMSGGKNEAIPTPPPASPPENVDVYGLSPLHHAVIRADFKKAEDLIQTGSPMDLQDLYGWTPLHWAAFNGDPNIYGLLIKNGADTTAKATKKWFKYPAGITAPEIKNIHPEPATQEPASRQRAAVKNGRTKESEEENKKNES